jgi:chromosome segregation ATPase
MSDELLAIIDGLKAEIERLRAESNMHARACAKVVEDLAARDEQIAALAEKLSNAERRSEFHHQNHLAAEREVDRLRSELAAEWDHSDKCPFGADEWDDDLKDADCTCGLEAALGGGE